MDSEGILYIAFFAAAVCGLIGATLLYSRDRAGTGFVLGFLLGPIGLIIAAVMRLEPAPAPVAAASAAPPESPKSVAPPRPTLPLGMKKCPDCAEVIQGEARKCRYCGADVSAVAAVQ